ncbi:MaoC/PaaZ C-terminal domain-containing protein [Pseudoxanthomonas mexicana]
MNTTTRRDLEWDLDQRPLKDLARLIVAERVDRVAVVADNASTLAQLDRLGYPVEPGANDGNAAAGQRNRCVIAPHLSLSLLPVRNYEYRISPDDVEAYARCSGDWNPIHFDDAAAREQGFEGRISHGMLFNGWFTRLLGTEYPGHGTLYLRSQCLYQAPVYPERDYSIRVSTPRHNPAKGTYLIVAQLFDAEHGHHASIAYADVMNRGDLAADHDCAPPRA